MAHFIDRRLNGKNKSAVNRQRFIRRYKQQIKQAVSDAISKRSVTDINNGEKVSIPGKDITEPFSIRVRVGTENAYIRATISSVQVIKSNGLKVDKAVVQVRAMPVQMVKAKTNLCFQSPKTNTWICCLKI